MPGLPSGWGQVINGGFAAGSHWPAGYVHWIEEDGLAFHPDILILSFCLNDMGDIPLLAYPVADPAPWLGGRSRLLHALQRWIEQRRLIRNHNPDMADIVRANPEPWERNRAAIREIRDLARARGVRFVVAVFPMLSLLGADYPYLGLHQMLAAEVCAADGIECVDLLDRFRGRGEGDLWVHATDQHPNDEGHRLIAEGIHAYLAGTAGPGR